MRKRRGLSMDQKKELMHNIITKRNEVFNIKELEKRCKKVGIHFKVVKEVLENIIADNLVKSEKIGAGNFYWSYQSD